MNKELARQKTVLAFKENCEDHERWEKDGHKFDDDPRTFGKIISCTTEDNPPSSTLKFSTGKEYKLFFDKSVSYYRELMS